MSSFDVFTSFLHSCPNLCSNMKGVEGETPKSNDGSTCVLPSKVKNT